MNDLLQMEVFWSALSAVLMLILTFLPPVLRYIGIKDAERLMKSLHSAILSSARAAVTQGLSPRDAAILLLKHLFESEARTMAKLQPAPAVLGTLFQGYVGKAAHDLGMLPASGTFPDMADAVVSEALAAYARRQGA